MSQENTYSSIENYFNSLYSLNSSTDKNIEEYFSRNRFIPLKSPIFSSDEKRTTANEDISQEDSFSHILRNNSESFSSNKNAERNNIFKEENTNQKDTIDKDRVLNANEKYTKRTKDKTKNNKKPLFKVIGRKTRRYKKKYNILIKIMRNFFRTLFRKISSKICIWFHQEEKQKNLENEFKSNFRGK